MHRIPAIAALATLLSACTAMPDGPGPASGPGPGPGQALLKAACDLTPPSAMRLEEAPIYYYTFRTQISPTERLNRSTSIAGDGQPWLMSSLHMPLDGCPSGDVLAVRIDESKIRIRFEYAGIVNAAPLGQAPQYEQKRITIEDEFQVQRGLQVTRQTAGGTYSLAVE